MSRAPGELGVPGGSRDRPGTLVAEDAKPRRPLAAATVVQIHGVLRKALRDALKWGYVATLAEPPSNASVKAGCRRAIHVWSPQQLASFLAATRDHWLYALWLPAATTGLRRGELAGIVDAALDLETARLVVDWQPVPEKRIGEPGRTVPLHKRVMKSSGSSRPIDLDRFTVSELRRWLAKHTEWQHAVGHGRPGAADLFPCVEGHAGRGHDSFLFTWPDGPHLKVVQERLGWSSTQTMTARLTGRESKNVSAKLCVRVVPKGPRNAASGPRGDPL